MVDPTLPCSIFVKGNGILLTIAKVTDGWLAMSNKQVEQIYRHKYVECKRK